MVYRGFTITIGWSQDPQGEGFVGTYNIERADGNGASFAKCGSLREAYASALLAQLAAIEYSRRWIDEQ